jgi:superfamily II DNA/RNA helicase
LRDIKANRYSLIVCSDLLARGMDIPDVSDVVSVDLPLDSRFLLSSGWPDGPVWERWRFLGIL